MSLQWVCGSHCNTRIFQAIKDGTNRRGTLLDIFERVESFLRRLKIYTEMPLTTEMMETIIQMMVDVFVILGVAKFEIKQGRMSE
jgi:hypothetical protein